MIWLLGCFFVGYVAYYLFTNVSTTEVICSGSNTSLKLLNKTKILNKTFWPLLFCGGAYIQTILPSFIRKTENILYKREIYTFKDGGTSALDFAYSKNYIENEKLGCLLLVCPGLTGTSKTKYILQTVKYLLSFFPSIVIFNYRGLSIPLSSANSYNGSDTRDLDEIVKYLVSNKLKTDGKLFAIGFSLGSNILSKYVGLSGSQNTNLIKAAVSVSNPFDFLHATSFWNTWHFKLFLGTHLAKFLKIALQPNLEVFQKAGFDVQTEKILACKTVADFDKNFTIKIGGWDTLEDYYESASCKYHLKNIKIPMLFVNANDDPLCPKAVHPVEEFKNNDKIILVRTTYGGHVGWCSLFSPCSYTYSDILAKEFFKQVLDLYTNNELD